MYKIIDIEKNEVIEIQDMEEMLEFLNENVENFNRDWVIDDMDVCGISTAKQFTVLDMEREEKSDLYDLMEEYIKQFVK